MKSFVNLYALPNIMRMFNSRWMRLEDHVTHMGEMRNTNKILVGGHDRKRSLGRPSHRWEDNIRMHLTEIR
jgi:hypothetical protein